jgi:5,5'-dehydrodivanillate O-demethylase oxygenase subunit
MTFTQSRASARALSSQHPAEIEIATTRPGTPGGIFMRQFWHAVCRSQDLPAGHAKPIRIMSEDYAIYRGQSGAPQVVAYRCPHRGAPLHLGWVEDDAIRCVYHGWKFDHSGQCVHQPAEEEGFARKVSLRTFPTREYLDSVFAYFGAGEPPPFPHFPHRQTEGVIQVWNAEHVPCNYLQSFENSMDEVHVAFAHQPGGSHAEMSVDLPIITAEETDWGVLRFGTRRTGKVRQTLHYAPNLTRVMVPPLAGMDGVGGWSEIYFSFTPVDDGNHLWLITSHVEVTGKDAEGLSGQTRRIRPQGRGGSAGHGRGARYLVRKNPVCRRHPSRSRRGAGYCRASRPRPHRRPRQRTARPLRCRHHSLAQNSGARTARHCRGPRGKKMADAAGRCRADFGILAARDRGLSQRRHPKRRYAAVSPPSSTSS